VVGIARIGVGGRVPFGKRRYCSVEAGYL